ncbi:hypothetical protein DV515_00000398 [Chloebia gouldiae]|uniref:DDE-1 domain-containing protein n=1 Tax=Chloebia gouldiae TaxID=44316 RepID=A0A3L8T0U7_CHLGU|nr:hypothetical protein DV515_00000398 [Chloebia gouldiae]
MLSSTPHCQDSVMERVSFDEPSNNIIEKIGTKSAIIKTLGNEKMCITVMLAVLADGIKLPTYVILKRKTMQKDQLPTGIIVRCQNQGWMSTDLMKDWHHLEQETRNCQQLASRFHKVLRHLQLSPGSLLSHSHSNRYLSMRAQHKLRTISLPEYL